MNLGCTLQLGVHPFKLNLRLKICAAQPNRTTLGNPSKTLNNIYLGRKVQAQATGVDTRPLDKKNQNPASDNFGPKPAASRTYLKEIRITDFALVDDQRIQLKPGLNVITGESGSGKSVLLEAIGQLLGATASEDLVRLPAQFAVVEGQLSLATQDIPTVSDLLKSLGVPQRAISALQDSNICIKREILLNGDGKGARSRCFINGYATSLRVLRELGDALFDINGQHSSLALRNANQQLVMLDRMAGTSDAATALAATWQALESSRARLKALDELADEGQREELQQLANDVVCSDVQPGNDLALRLQLRQMDARRAAAERCQMLSIGIGGAGGDGGGLLDALRDVEGHLRAIVSQEERLAASTTIDSGVNDDDEDWSEDDQGASGEEALKLLHQASTALDAAREALYDAESAVERYARRYRFSQAEYDEASSRLQLLERMMKQYDCASADELIEAADRAEAALDSYFQASGKRGDLEAEREELEVKAAEQAMALSVARRRAAQHLRRAVTNILSDLAMEGSAFDIKFSWQEAGTDKQAAAGLYISEAAAGVCIENGGGHYIMRSPAGHLDSVEFLFAAGPGEPLRPLSAVASGGEAARLMLALKAAPAYVDGMEAPADADTATATPSTSGTPVLVLDEIDSGVGSRLGQPVGRILRHMVGSTTPSQQVAAQVLAVSHLPQVAAHADHHHVVRKSSGQDGRVVTRFMTLPSYEDRLAEVAAMLGLPIDAAEQMMAAAGWDNKRSAQ